ncbi:hypothetical protein CFT13S00388_10035, partial [Campylobacter fetus subsp. testudinum]
SIGDSAFENNKGIREAAFLYCRSIGTKAFYNARTSGSEGDISRAHLENLTFNNVNSIPEYAFYTYARADGYR